MSKTHQAIFSVINKNRYEVYEVSTEDILIKDVGLKAALAYKSGLVLEKARPGSYQIRRTPQSKQLVLEKRYESLSEEEDTISDQIDALQHQLQRLARRISDTEDKWLEVSGAKCSCDLIGLTNCPHR